MTIEPTRERPSGEVIERVREVAARLIRGMPPGNESWKDGEAVATILTYIEAQPEGDDDAHGLAWLDDEEAVALKAAESRLAAAEQLAEALRKIELYPRSPDDLTNKIARAALAKWEKP